MNVCNMNRNRSLSKQMEIFIFRTQFNSTHRPPHLVTNLLPPCRIHSPFTRLIVCSVKNTQHHSKMRPLHRTKPLSIVQTHIIISSNSLSPTFRMQTARCTQQQTTIIRNLIPFSISFHSQCACVVHTFCVYISLEQAYIIHGRLPCIVCNAAIAVWIAV